MEITPRYIPLSDRDIGKFKEVFKKPNGATYSDEEAHEAAQNLIGFFDFLLRIDERNKREGRYKKTGRGKHRRTGG
jgi:hypothetical protein